MNANISQAELALRRIGSQLNRRRGAHLYAQITQLIRQQIESGSLKPGDMLPTQRELAALWGVGEVTIRRALRDLASEDLLNARPGSGTVVLDPRNDRATPPASNDVLTVGVACTDLADGYPFLRPIIQGLREDGHEVALRLFDIPTQERVDEALAHAPPLRELDGLIMMTPVNLGLLALCQHHHLPTVLMFNDLSDGFSHCVTPNYTRGVMEAVQHLSSSGRKRVALVTAGDERFSTGRWIETYRAALQAFDLSFEPDWLVKADYTERAAADVTHELLSLAHPPDAILYASDIMARGGLLAAHASGVRVPEELAVVGAGPVLAESGWTVPLTTINLGLVEMGRRARQAIAASRREGFCEPLRQAVAANLQIGMTA